MRQFIKEDNLTLINGGYLSNKKSGEPVYNEAFVQAQKRAEYIVKFAEQAKGKDFKGKVPDSIDDLKAAVAKELADDKPTYIDGPKKVKKKLSDQLADEALAFMEFKDESQKVDKMNEFLQEFNILNEFEEFGLFFDDEIVKLKKIYTMKEVVSAVKETIDLL